jgi:hypothetical protein
MVKNKRPLKKGKVCVTRLRQEEASSLAMVENRSRAKNSRFAKNYFRGQEDIYIRKDTKRRRSDRK